MVKFGRIYGIILGMASILDSIYKDGFLEVIGDYNSSIPEPTIKQNFKHTKTFYQESILKENKLYYNKTIPRCGKKKRGEYLSIQSKARDRRSKIRKTLEGKI